MRSRKSIGRHVRTIVALLAGGLGLSSLTACMPVTTGTMEGIGFRQARFQEIQTMSDYRACVDDALRAAEQAKTSGQVGGHRASAKIFERCEADLGSGGIQLAREERMRNYALGILNYLKAGDVKKVQANVEIFKKVFDGYDLYLPNGASFIDTLTFLTAKHDDAPSPQVMALMNVSPKLRAEIQRVQYWKHN